MNDDLIQPQYMVRFYIALGVVAFFVLWMVYRGIASFWRDE